MSEHITRSDLLEHETQWKDRLNRAKEEIYWVIQKDRHDSKERDIVLGHWISENKENIALHNQGQEFMKEQVRTIAENVREIKQIVESQSENFATKRELEEKTEENKSEIKGIKNDHKKFLLALIGWCGSVIFLLIDKFLK